MNGRMIRTGAGLVAIVVALLSVADAAGGDRAGYRKGCRGGFLARLFRGRACATRRCDPCPPSPCAKRAEASSMTGNCPFYCPTCVIAVHDEYTTYRAVHCETGDEINLDGPDGLTLNLCPENCDTTQNPCPNDCTPTNATSVVTGYLVDDGVHEGTTNHTTTLHNDAVLVTTKYAAHDGTHMKLLHVQLPANTGCNPSGSPKDVHLGYEVAESEIPSGAPIETPQHIVTSPAPAKVWSVQLTFGGPAYNVLLRD